MMTQLSQERLRDLLDYSPETGKFTRLSTGEPAGYVSKRGYVHITVDGSEYKAHRLAWLYTTGAWPVAVIDHIDGDGLNNRFANLREATQTQNCFNAKSQPRSNGLPRGVYRTPESSTFTAMITVKNRRKYLGSFKTSDEASEFYQLAADLLHGEFAFYRSQGATQRAQADQKGGA